MQILFLEIIKIIFPYFIYSHELIYEYLQSVDLGHLNWRHPLPPQTLSVKIFFVNIFLYACQLKNEILKKKWVAHRVKKVLFSIK